jgi:hypothetical protein
LRKPFSVPDPDFDRFAQRVEELRQVLHNRSPQQLAALTGASYTALDAGHGEFQLSLWKRPVRLTFPALTAYPAQSQEMLPGFHQALLLYYFTTADGIPLSGSWISFAELPDGRFYNQAFQGYSGQELARSFGNNLNAFEQAAQSLGGMQQSIADAAFAFQALPRVPLLAVYWRGDEDFPPSCQILFDASASHYLPCDACAILGSTLTHQLIKAKPA